MANPRHLANELLTRYKLKRPTLENVVFIVGDHGYEVIDFDPGSSSAENLFKELALDEVVYVQDAFLYTNHDVKLLFLNDRLDAEEKKCAAAHELGHIVCGHTQTKPSVREEYEANEFVHYFLNPNIGILFRNSIARNKLRSILIALAAAVLVAGGATAIGAMIDQKYSPYYATELGKKYHVQSCIQIRGKSNVRRLTKEELERGEYEPCGTCLRDHTE